MTVVLSDLDGVLVDSYASIMRAWRWWGARHGVEATAIEAIAHGRSSADVIAVVAPHLDAVAEGRELDLREAADTDGVVALPGADELFARFGREGRLAVVTSGQRPLATARLRAAGLPIPSVLVTPERIRRGKPDPEGYLLAARELGADPARCIVLEDAPAGVAAGRAAGMRVVGVATTHAAAELDAAHEVVPSVAAWLRR